MRSQASEGYRPSVLAAAVVLMAAGLTVVGVAAPAQAAPVERWGFALVDTPTVPVWTNLNPAFQATSPSSPNVQGGTLGHGRFRVRFIDLAAGSRGNVHVTAIGVKGNYCQTVRWFAAGTDELVDVQCFAPGGIMADTPFAVMWTVNATLLPTSAAAYASVQYGVATGVVQFYNSTGGGVTATPVAPGVTDLRFDKVGVAGLLAGDLQVTAIGGRDAHRCKVAWWDDDHADVVAQVWCFDAAGAFLDSDFTASYHRERPVVWALGPPKFLGYAWSRPLNPGNLQTNDNTATGGFGDNVVTVVGSDIDVVFPKLNVDETHVQVTAFGADPNYCTLITPWSLAGADVVVDATCFDPAGNPAPDEALITMTNRS